MFEAQAHLEKRRQEAVRSSGRINVADEALKSQMSFYSMADSNFSRLSEKSVNQYATIPCRDKATANRLTRAFLSSGIECEQFVNNKTNEISIAVADSQVNKAEIILNQYQMRQLHGMEVSKEMLYNSSRNHLQQMKDLSSAQVSMLVDLCKTNEVNYHVDGPLEEKYVVTFEQKDAEKMAGILQVTALETSGQTGEYYDRLTDFKERENKEILQRVKNPELLTDQQMQQQAILFGKTPEETAQMREQFRDSNKTVYLVDRESDLSLVVTKRYAKVNDERGLIRREKGNEELFVKQVNRIIQTEMKETILLTEDQYRKCISLEGNERKSFLHDIERQHGYPDATKEEIAEFRLKEKYRNQLLETLSAQLCQDKTVSIQYTETTLHRELRIAEQEYLQAHAHDDEMVIQALNIDSLDFKTEERLADQAATAFDLCSHTRYAEYLYERKGEQIIHSSEYELNADEINEMIDELRREESLDLETNDTGMEVH